MKTFKLALIGTAALAALSVSARADDLTSLKSQIDGLNLSAVADAPAAPATTVTWTGWARGGVVTGYNATNTVSSSTAQYATDIITRAEVVATAKTETAVGEVGVKVALESSNLSEKWDNGFNTANGGGGAVGPVTTDGFSGWWKMTPNLTMTVGVLGTLAKSGYSFDAICTCWIPFDGGGVGDNSNNGATFHDPAAVQLAYADGPLSAAFQIEDANNYRNNSAFGVSGKVGYKMDAFGIDVNGGYWGAAGNAAGNQTASYNIGVGVGYSAGAFGLGASISTGQTSYYSAQRTPGSVYATLKMSDQAHLELGVTHDFSTDGNDGSAGVTVFAGGLYYTPVSQITIGAEAAYQSGNGNNKTINGTGNGNYGFGDGGYEADLVAKFSF